MANNEQSLDRTQTFASQDIESNKIGQDSTISQQSNLAADNFQFDDLEVISEIGRGGMGVVYKCKQTSLNRIVAVKSVLAGVQLSEEARTRFISEALAVASLKHENVVAIHEVNQHSRPPYLVMEYVEGASLDQLISSENLHERRIIHLVRQITRAMIAAHEKRIVHRDLKPANVLVEKNDHVKVTDFGLAKTLGDNESPTLDGQLLGTPSYMAPEQTTGSATIDERTDVYAIGATLYACITGAAPFRANSILEVLNRVRSTEPIAPKTINTEISRDLNTVCLKCLNKRRATRYQSATELLDELDRLSEGKPIKARPISTLAKTWRLAKRKPWQTAFSFVLALALLALLVIPLLIASSQARELSMQRQFRTSGLEVQLDLAINGGDWKRGLEACESLLKFQPTNTAYRFDKIRCLYALGKRIDVEGELNDLERHQLTGADLALYSLWKAEVGRASGDRTTVHKWLDNAIELNVLDDAEQKYAVALTLVDYKEIEPLMLEVLRRDPAHLRAKSYLFMASLHTGRLELARQRLEGWLIRSPDEFNLLIMKLIIDSALGDADVATTKQRIIELLGENEDWSDYLDSISDAYGRWATVMDTLEEGSQTADLRKFFQLPKDVGVAPGKRFEDLMTFDPNLLSVPFEWARRDAEVQAALGLTFFNRFEDAARRLEAIVDENSPGDIWYLIGQAYFLSGKYDAAAQAFAKAAETPARMKNTSREACWMAAMSWVSKWLESEKQNESFVRRAAEFARRHLDYGEAKSWHDETLCKICINANDFTTALRYLERLQANSDSPNIDLLKVRVLGMGTQMSKLALEQIESMQQTADLTEPLKEYKQQIIEGLRAQQRFLPESDGE